MSLSTVISSQIVYQSLITLESVTIELVPKAYKQIFPYNTLSSFTIFLPKQLNMDGRWEVAFSKTSYPSMYQNVTKGKFVLLTKNFQSRQVFIIWNLVFTLPFWILLRPWTISFNRKTITGIAVSQLYCLEERKRLRFILEMKDLALHFLLQPERHFWKECWQWIWCDVETE